MGLYRLDAIRLQNFMAFEDTGWIEFKPITLLFGRNSSGKSAIIRALLLLKQSLEQNGGDSPLIVSGRLIDLGSFMNAIHQHHLTNEVKFSFRIVLDDETINQLVAEKRAKDDKDGKTSDLSDLEIASKIANDQEWIQYSGADPSKLEITLGFRNKTNAAGISYGEFSTLEVCGCNKRDWGDDPKLIFGSSLSEQNSRTWRWKTEVLNVFPYDDLDGSLIDYQPFEHPRWHFAELNSRDTFVPSLWAVEHTSKKPTDWQVMELVLNLFRTAINDLLKKMVYLPPLREPSKRFYSIDTQSLQGLWNTQHDTIFKDMNGWLKSISANSEIISNPVRLQEGLVSIYIKDEIKAGETPLEVNLRDSGSGFAQVLPIFSALASASSGSLILIEQPELHLHPAAQAELADIFLLANEKTNCSFLLETHSSSLINRIRRRVAEGAFSSDDFAGIFVNRAGGTSRCRKISLEADGNYTVEAHELAGFFSADANELVLMRITSQTGETQQDIEKVRKDLKRFEHLFDGEKVNDMFAILGIHAASSTRMMRVWGEYVTKKIARDKGVEFKDKEDLDPLINRLVNLKIFDVDIKRQADAFRTQGNFDSHASSEGIQQLSVQEACDTLKSLVNYLKRLEAKGLI